MIMWSFWLKSFLLKNFRRYESSFLVDVFVKTISFSGRAKHW